MVALYWWITERNWCGSFILVDYLVRNWCGSFILVDY